MAHNDTGRMAIHSSRALDLFTRIGDHWSTAHVVKHVSWLALTTGNGDDAVRLRAAAVAMHAAIGVSASATHYAAQDSRLAEARSVLGERAFNEAWRAGQSLAPDEIIGQANALLQMMHGDAGPADVGSRLEDARLTRREWEIARMLADGCTDREIADALSISPRTVHGHVANVLAKLGVTSRTAAAAYLIRRGLH